jgi:hypothetical protein
MKAAILLIDDYPGVRDLLEYTMRLPGYNAALASNLFFFLDYLSHKYLVPGSCLAWRLTITMPMQQP